MLFSLSLSLSLLSVPQTASFSLGVLSRVDLSKRHPQAIILCPTRELSMQVAEVIRSLARYTTVEVFAAVPVHPPRKEKIHAQIVVGTPGTVDAKIAHRELDVKGIQMFVADEADQMIAQEGLGDKTVQIKKKLPKSTQILLFSATFDDATRKFAKVVAPNAVEIMVKTEELSLDGIKQYFMDCRDEADKYKALTEIFSLLEIGQSIIFVHVRRDSDRKRRHGGGWPKRHASRCHARSCLLSHLSLPLSSCVSLLRLWRLRSCSRTRCARTATPSRCCTERT